MPPRQWNNTCKRSNRSCQTSRSLADKQQKVYDVIKEHGPVTNEEIKKLEAVEEAEAQKRGMEEFKFSSNEDMFQAIGLAEATV